MEPDKTRDINVASNKCLPQPMDVLKAIPKTEAQSVFVSKIRQEITNIIEGKDKRFLMVVGPCSIHDVIAGREYAKKIVDLAARVNDRILVVMRVYFEKPRTTTGWKGLIIDPHLDGSYDIETGLRVARDFLREVIDLGVANQSEYTSSHFCITSSRSHYATRYCGSHLLGCYWCSDCGESNASSNGIGFVYASRL